MVEIPVLRTERLILRGWRTSDLALFAALNADPVVMEFLGRGPMSRAESDASAARIAEHWRARGYGLWAVEVPGVADFIGDVGLVDATFEAPFTPAVEISWRLAHAHWGNGYATEAALAAVRFGYRDAGLPEVLSFTAATNDRSRAVMTRLGLQHVPGGDFEHPAVPVGHRLRPHVLYRFPTAPS